MDTNKKKLPNIKTYEDLIADTENTWDFPKSEEDVFLDTKYIGKEAVQYNIIFGNEKIVFIKTGAGGSLRGNDNKYIQMARKVHDRLGATVICSPNPDVPSVDLDEEEIRWVVSEIGLINFELYFVGASDGAYQNLILASKFPETVKFLGINTSYISRLELKEKLCNLHNVDKTLVCGTKDRDSLSYVPYLQKANIPNLTIKLIDGANHKFTGMIDTFISLIDLL